MQKEIFQFGLLAVFGALFYLQEKKTEVKKAFPVLLLLLTLLAWCVHVNFFRFHGTGTHVHNLEMYHYYMGSKYFPETGYTKLYEASVAADSLDDPYFRPELGVRSLETYQLISREEVLKRREEIIRLFSPSRWQSFRQDLAVFRNTAPKNWGTKFAYQDHGYNGTPFVTSLLSLLSSNTWMSTERFIKLAACLDPILIFLSAFGLALLLSPLSALTFLFFLGVNPFNDYSMIGGSFLRYDFLIFAVLGTAWFRRERWGLAGAAFALSGLSRIFPFLFLAGLPFTFFSQRYVKEKWLRFKALRRFFFLAAVTGLAMVPLTSGSKIFSAENPWLGFMKQIQFHGERFNVNRVGLKYLFGFSEKHNTLKVLQSWPEGERLSWADEMFKTFQSKKYYFAAAALALAAAALLFARGAVGTESFFAGSIWVFAFLSLSNYYYIWLALLPLFFEERRKPVLWITAAMAIVTLIPLLPAAAAVPDRRFFLLNLALGLTLACAVFAKIAPMFFTPKSR